MSIQAYLEGLNEAEKLFVGGAFAPAEAILSTALRGRTPEALSSSGPLSGPLPGSSSAPSAQSIQNAPTPETEQPPVFSVIVDGHDCQAVLADLTNQTMQEFEVLQVCGGTNSQSDTGDNPPTFATDKFRCFTPPVELPLAEIRNLAALLAKGAILVFLDASCRVEPDFLEQVARGFARYDILALRGRLLPRTPSSLNYRLDRYDAGETAAASSLDVRSGFAVVRDVLLRFGGFCPLLTETHGRELAFRIHGEFGQGAVAYLPSVRVRRDVAPDEGTFVGEEARARLEEAYLCTHRPGFCHTLADQGVMGLAPQPRATSVFALPPHAPAKHGEKDFELGMMLRERGSFAALADHFKDADHEPFASLRTSALLQLRQTEALKQALGKLSPSEENRLKKRTAELLPEIDRRAKAMAAGTGKDAAPNRSEPRVHVLLLCWNRADYVREAVRQLGQTEYDNWALYVADNGSTDETWEELQAGLATLPSHVEVHVERFPMNIGRPVGHDWLLTKFDHSASEFIAIADDDLFHIPPTWLRDMVATAQVFPRAGVVGGKAYGEERPRLIHGAVRNLLWYDRDDFVLSHGRDNLDYGQMDYIDLTDHVIGCLHIYRTEVFFGPDTTAQREENTPKSTPHTGTDAAPPATVGLFDIGLSPCQMVDVDHHLRCRLAGWQVVYNGLVEFGHARQGGKTAQATSAKLGNVLGNQVKVLYKHEPDVVRAMLDRAAKAREIWLETGETPED